MSQGTSLVTVLVPIYRETLTREEAISFGHLRHFLGQYDTWIVAPRKLKVQLPGLGKKSFDDRYFVSVESYSKLLLSREFYEAFTDYKYALIYQLDCLAFSDELASWCSTGCDYIGAPWLKTPRRPSDGFARVGNGGLSLRKVESFLRVIDSRRYVEEPVSLLRDVCITPLLDTEHLSTPRALLKRLRVFRSVQRGVKWYMSNYTLNEDRFWSDRAQIFYPGFKIASIETALRFSFEAAPRFCFERTHRTLPFGCHGWHKHDREFWSAYLLR